MRPNMGTHHLMVGISDGPNSGYSDALGAAVLETTEEVDDAIEDGLKGTTIDVGETTVDRSGGVLGLGSHRAGVEVERWEGHISDVGGGVSRWAQTEQRRTGMFGGKERGREPRE